MNLGGVIHLNRNVCIVCAFILLLFLYVLTKNDNQHFRKNNANLKDILKLSIHAAESGGAQITSLHNFKVEMKGKTKEGANDSVTTADFNSHCAMTKIFHDSFSHFNIISEEKTNCENFQLSNQNDRNLEDMGLLEDVFVNLWDITIWIDPLDATQEYTEKLNEYVTTMVCIAVKGEPVIGIIHKPFLKETYWAWVNNGKSSNMISKMPENESTTKFIISRSHSGKIRKLIEKQFTKFSIIEAGGAGFKVLELIMGNADVYIHSTSIKKWDICAGNAILNALGGKMTTLSGGHITYGSESTAENTDGLIAALRNHELYIKV